MVRGGKNTKAEAGVELLEEIMVEILLRLPVKSLLTFKTVCKSWYSIISSDRFIRQHLKLAKAATYNQHKRFLGLLVPRWEACNTCVLFKEESGGVIVAKEFDFPTTNLAAPDDEIPVRACNSCDGLICFQMRDDNSMLLWNPSLPAEYKVIESTSYTGFAGMGYDPATNDYKIVSVPRFSVDDEFPDGYLFVQLFSLKRDSWTTLKITKTKDYAILSMAIIYAKNHLHWVAGEYSGRNQEDYIDLEDDKLFIVYFDMDEDRVNYLNLPPSTARPHPINYKESIAIVSGHLECEVELWVLQEDRGMDSIWNKIFKISVSYMPANCCFAMNGELLVFKENGLGILDTEDGSMKDVATEGDDFDWGEEYFRGIFTTPYVESLVSPIRLQ